MRNREMTINRGFTPMECHRLAPYWNRVTNPPRYIYYGTLGGTANRPRKGPVLIAQQTHRAYYDCYCVHYTL